MPSSWYSSPWCWCSSQGWTVFSTSFPTTSCWAEPRAGTAGQASYMGICGASPRVGLASQSHANISQAVMLIMAGIRELYFLNLTKWLCFEGVGVFLYGRKSAIIVCLVFPRFQGRGDLQQLNQRWNILTKTITKGISFYYCVSAYLPSLLDHQSC